MSVDEFRHGSLDALYLSIILEPLRVCANYKPKLGQGGKSGGLTLEQFQNLYRADPFYNWVGLDQPAMYTAHKVAGGMTSIYRQFRNWLQKTLSKDSVRLIRAF